MVEDAKPVLIGMNNPYGTDPKYALYPLSRNTAGHRLWEMLSYQLPAVSLFQYANAFDRRNLQTGPWVPGKVAAACASAAIECLWGRTVLLLGTEVHEAFGLFSAEPVGCELREGAQGVIYFNWIPHPSGRNKWYNEPVNWCRVSRVLARLYTGERGLLREI